MRKTLLLLGLAIVVVLALAGCGGDEEQTTTTAPPATQAPGTETTGTTEPEGAAGPATGEPIKVGFSNSLTGVGAAPGESVRNGAELQVEWVNANGGVNGRPLELVMLDDGSDVPSMIANLTRLIEQEGVSAIVGPFIQFGQEAARGVTEAAQIPHVAGGPAELSQLEGDQYEWSVMISAAPPTQFDASLEVIKEYGYENILAMADVLTIHQDTLDLLVEAAASEGYQMTKMPDTFGFDVTDFQPIMNRIMEEYNRLQPDALFLYTNPIAVPALYRGLRSLGVTVPIHGSPAAAHPAIFSQGPEAVEGLFVMDSGGIVNPQALPDDWPLKELQLDFTQRYTEEYGSPPNFFSAFGADFIIVLTEALTQAGDPDDKEAVRDALLNLSDVEALEGIVNFAPDDTHEGVKGSMVLFEVTNGSFEFVRALN